MTGRDYYCPCSQMKEQRHRQVPKGEVIEPGAKASLCSTQDREWQEEEEENEKERKCMSVRTSCSDQSFNVCIFSTLGEGNGGSSRTS